MRTAVGLAEPPESREEELARLRECLWAYMQERIQLAYLRAIVRSLRPGDEYREPADSSPVVIRRGERSSIRSIHEEARGMGL